ncbi:MAG TPA: chemotaxis-specific protein-glutamate methyltransferase CheB [Pirellulales bacterium]
MNKIRVLIVEDSQVVRAMLQHVIGKDPRLEVVGAVGSAEEALRILHEISPDVVSMDVRLPGMNGLEATQQIMRDKPTPIVVVAASVAADDLGISTNALRTGALAVVEKPVGINHRDYEAMADRLCSQLAVMSQVKVVRQRLNRRARQPAAAEPPPPCAGNYALVGIVASTGGPAAVQKLLVALGPRFPLPIALVQHMSAGFLEGFVSWLASACPLRVVVAEEGGQPVPGTVHVAAADRHLQLENGAWHLGAGLPVCSQRPSGSVLFRSMAQGLGPRALGILLTGMGEDGAAGLKDLYEAGGYTIAEHESTAIVYGMPKAAVRLGAVCESLPLDRIGPRLGQLCPIVQERSS